MLYLLLATIATFSCSETQDLLENLATVRSMSTQDKADVAEQLIQAAPASCGFNLQEYIQSINDATL